MLEMITTAEEDTMTIDKFQFMDWPASLALYGVYYFRASIQVSTQKIAKDLSKI